MDRIEYRRSLGLPDLGLDYAEENVMDVAKADNRTSGVLCTKSHGSEIVWDGCLCEGANLTQARDENFCLWTRCGKRDVPADHAHEGDIREVTCPDCLALWNEGNGQFGVGA